MKKKDPILTRNEIVVHGKKFRPFLDEETIRERVRALGREIAEAYRGEVPFFLGILNGAFVFTADLVRACDVDCEVAFLRLSSYNGMNSTGKVQTLLGLDVQIKGRPVIVVEDIVDTGRTMSLLLKDLQDCQPASLAIAALLSKPEAIEVPVKIDYLGFEIPNKFIIGYGLDYDGVGRNLPDIYQIKEEHFV